MASGCGKVILIGEHAVVYGIPAIACGIDRGASASAEIVPKNSLEAQFEARTCGEAPFAKSSVLTIGTETFRQNNETPTALAFASLLKTLDAPAIAAHAESQLPPGCGLGGSAALGVAIARAVLAACGKTDVDCSQTLAAAAAWEKVFHGAPSGIDATTSALGGVIRFIRGKEVCQLHLGRDLELVIAVADKPASTRTMVEKVASLRKEKPTLVDRAFRTIEALSQVAEKSLATGDLSGLGEVLDCNHELLEELELSTPRLEAARKAAKKAGALGAKLTGSGGGGAILALVEANTSDRVVKSLQALEIDSFATRVRRRPDSR